MKEIFASTEYGLIGLLFFFAFFVCISIWAFRPKAKDTFKEFGNIPLKEIDE